MPATTDCFAVPVFSRGRHRRCRTAAPPAECHPDLAWHHLPGERRRGPDIDCRGRFRQPKLACQQISTRLKEHSGACPVPQEGRSIRCVDRPRRRANSRTKMIQFTSGEADSVPRTPQSKPFEGVGAVRVPPKKERDGDRLYTEVVTISAATFPDRVVAGIQILANP